MKNIAEMEAGVMKNCWNGSSFDEKNKAERKQDFI